MSRDALPCIVCGEDLRNVTDDSENQPSEGTAFMTYGHYGSTVFDPMDGTALEANICDGCLTNAASKGRVLWNRRYKPIMCDGVVVGREWVDRPLIPWDPSVERMTEPTDSDESHIEPDDVGQEDRRIEWRPEWREIVADIRRHRAQDEGSADDD